MTSKTLRLWECALLLAFSLTLVTGVWAAGSQSALAGQVVRLHVIANSDSDADQALKLQVRDAVLSAAAPLLEGVSDQSQAEQVLSAHLQELADAGAAVVAYEGYSYPVAVSLEDCWFPTREYEDFALPAGTYRALRVVIGAGEGRNWWCVVFPPLCTAAACQWQDAGRAAGLEEDDLSLMAEEDAGYELRFRSVELWEMLRQWLGK